MELRASALQYKESNNPAADINSLALSDHSLDITCFVAVAEEGVWVWLAINRHSGPAMCDNLDVGSGNVRIGFDKVGSEDAGKELRWGDWVLFCLDIHSILH